MLSQYIELYRFYVRNHRTLGCRVTHLAGIPLIALSFLLLPKRPKTSVMLGAVGYALQILGHYVFEKNTPVLMRTKDVRVIPVAFAFIGYEWWAVFTKRFPKDNPDDLVDVFDQSRIEESSNAELVRASNGKNRH